MAKDVKPGDLVWMARGHSCTLAIYGGVFFTVDKIGEVPRENLHFQCQICGENIQAGVSERYVVYPYDPTGDLPEAWLDVVDPSVDSTEDTRDLKIDPLNNIYMEKSVA